MHVRTRPPHNNEAHNPAEKEGLTTCEDGRVLVERDGVDLADMPLELANRVAADNVPDKDTPVSPTRCEPGVVVGAALPPESAPHLFERGLRAGAYQAMPRTS